MVGALSKYCENFCEVWLTALIDDLDCCDMTACWRHVADAAPWEACSSSPPGRPPTGGTTDTSRRRENGGWGTPYLLSQCNIW